MTKTQKTRLMSLTTALLMGASVCALTSNAQAQMTLYDNKDGTTITGTATAVFGFFGVGNTDFGAGNINTGTTGASLPANTSPTNRKTDREWAETSVMPGLGIAFPSFFGPVDKGSLYGNLSLVGQGTTGDGDATSSLAPQGLRSTTGNSPFHLDLETIAGGWKSGDTFKDMLGTDAIDLSYGDQSFLVGDGLVIDTGILPGWRRGAYYTSLQTAFQRTAILKLNPDGVPLRGNVFKLENRSNQDLMQGNDNPESKLVGFNGEFFKAGTPPKDSTAPVPDVWTLGMMYFNIYDSDSPSLANQAAGSTVSSLAFTNDRKGLNVYSFRASGSFLDFFDPNILFHGEYVGEQNGGGQRKVDANAWYIEPGYTLANVMWSPTISARYAHFSGESNVNGTTKHNYDPLFFGAGPRGYGSWYMGEVYGWYMGAPSNINVWSLGVQSTPTDNTTLGLIFYDFSFATHQLASSTAANIPANSIRDNHAMDEIDIMGSWTPDQLKFLTLSSVLGFAAPGKGFSQAASAFSNANAGTGTATSTGSTMVVGELIATVKF